MKILLSYLGNLKEYIIFSALIVISLILIFQNDNVQIRFVRVIAVNVIGTIQDGFSFIPNIFELERENKSLRETNIDLSKEVSMLKEAKLENLRLNYMVEFKQRTNYNTVTGKIIGKTLIQTRNNITINVGENDSVKIGMPVITDKGLVGKVVATSGNYSIAQILFNKDLKVSAKVQRSRVDGIIAWDGEGKITMRNVSKSADVKVGDVIITSEYSNSFPAGIPIGYVTTDNTLDNLFKNIEVECFVNFETVEEVFVLKYLSDDERKELEKKFSEKSK
ncbi:MAG TPA: rod shape-determining protein MreC [Ignavibacteria bacterium]|nr:rod shape-determining protein MreC [Ignavibacteria bacterium]HAX50193.1 rod shape-determining protein MreC [Bacteroidota bacterium]HRE10122.1 rod shape-determining protein MreC [Ignavibacteria bacterium]HRF67208.1 rod shape-determining protein MreC [Ignavibacteria bacterium]HRJ03137.1 rod shape-determining protein MreC [Ignavibacteria bacterium]